MSTSRTHLVVCGVTFVAAAALKQIRLSAGVEYHLMIIERLS